MTELSGLTVESISMVRLYVNARMVASANRRHFRHPVPTYPHTLQLTSPNSIYLIQVSTNVAIAAIGEQLVD